MQSNPIWPVTERFPTFKGDTNADIVIVGGGIAGISSAYHLSKAGYKVVVLEKDEIGSGATGASSGVLYYGSGTNFVPAIEMYGKERATLLWNATAQVIEDIAKTIKEYNIECGFRRPGSVMIAKTDEEVKELQEEHERLKEIGIETKVLTSGEVKTIYPLVPFLAGLTFDACAQIRPARFAAALAKAAKLEVYEHSPVTIWQEFNGGIVVKTTEGQITCKKVIFATNFQDYFDLKKHFTLESSVILASPPTSIAMELWPKEKIMWSMEDEYDLIYPYEGRIILELYKFKGHKEKAAYYYPNIEFKVEKTWGESWAKASDWMPIVGKINDNIMVAIGMGDQGIIMGWLSGQKIVDLVEGKDNWFLQMTSPQRFSSAV
jgi:glycine/D-amino acid oxidase-like deaminating enzyme